MTKSMKIVPEKEDKIQKLFEYLDTNNSGTIDYSEFLVAVTDFHYQNAY